MLLGSRHSGKMLAYVTLSLADLYLTYALVQNSGGLIYESNPIANAWLARYGWTGLALFKLAAMLLVTLAVAYIACYRPQTADRILRFACCAVAFVVVYSFWLINSCSAKYPAQDRCSKYEDTMMIAAVAPRPAIGVSIAPNVRDQSKQFLRVSPTPVLSEAPLRKTSL
jgi:Domain of unknown function (DUF5658)